MAHGSSKRAISAADNAVPCVPLIEKFAATAGTASMQMNSASIVNQYPWNGRML